ncbi:MAG: indolepyruvate oxidoreductase subunit beta family protein, partial [Alphaproteobacteria bacterium]|nr:indolepyruvate oxidoreductase subunit beta family protein [Alphaproteobacteria bacterium]
VLSDWIVAAARASGYPVQSTSIPGVAQRTGATSYYIEIFPVPIAALGGRDPVLALYPAPGRVDIAIASELMEAGRAIENGYVTPDRTTLIASSHRIYSIYEKSAMGDGIFDTAKLEAAAKALASRAILFDMVALAEQERSVLNAVVLGVVAASERLPIPAAAFEAAIRDSGVAVESNLRGFKAGLAFVHGALALKPVAPPPRPERPTAETLAARARAVFPGEAEPIVQEGIKRLLDYQDARYATDYLDRLEPVAVADRAAGGAARGFALTREAARYLALMMSYEDIIRVADLKSRAARYTRVRHEVAAKPGEPVIITEFFKPGVDEIASILTPGLARALEAWADRKPSRRTRHLPMRVRTNTVTGFLRLWLLARLRPWRRKTARFAAEHAEIASWLEALKRALARDYALAVEIAELANLRKGYSDTHRRGVGNFRKIVATVVMPAIEGRSDPAAAAALLCRVREAALADPEGAKLDQALAAAVVPPSAPTALRPAAE